MTPLRLVGRILILPLAIAVGSAVLIRNYLVHTYSVPSASMAPTLHPGDHIVATPVGSGIVGRGEVIIFASPESGELFVKRVIGAGGDLIEIRDGVVYRNDEVLKESYVTLPTSATVGPLVVPRQHLFVLGDNRADSVDSRSFGFVPREAVVARARLIFWSSLPASMQPTASAASLTQPASSSRVRWERILRPVE